MNGCCSAPHHPTEELAREHTARVSAVALVHEGLVHLLELRRLMRRTRMSTDDALSLLLEQLRQFEEADRLEEDLQHAEYPRHVYGH